MKLKKPRRMLPGETIMEGDEYKFPPNGRWYDAIAFRGNTVTDVRNIEFRTYRPLPKKKKVKNVYTFDADGPYLFSIYRNGVHIAYSDLIADAQFICDALNEMEERK